MAREVWFDRLGEALQISGIAKYAAPFSATESAGVNFRLFGPFDAGAGNWQFSKGLRVEMPNPSPADALFAMATGSASYLAAADGAPGQIVLARGDAVAAATAQQSGGLPAWFPQPRLIVYENVDSGDAREAILTLLQDKNVAEGARVRIRKARKDPSFNATPEQLAALWLENAIPNGLPLTGGTRIGTCGISATADRLEATVKMVDSLTPAPSIFYNPSYYIALWDAMGWIPGGNSLLPLQSNTAGPAAATGRILFVKKTGSGTPPFSTPAAASPTIGPALTAADPADTVLILDTGTYAEELVINKPITLMSTSTRKATDASPLFPTVSGGSVRRPIRVSNVTGGIAHISHLAIINGVAAHIKEKGAGGGILVERTENSVISSCIVRDCRAEGGGIFAEGYGGGIGSYHSSPAIVGCLIEKNHAAGRGSGIGAWGYGWPTIFGCTVRSNIAPGSTPEGNIRGDGGGIAITIAVNDIESVKDLEETTRETLASRWNPEKLQRSRRTWARIQDCTIENNQALDDGGGIFISIASNVRVTNTTIKNNKAVHNGGGIRVTMRSELIVIGGRITANESNSDREEDTNAGGGGISSRNTTLVQLRGVTIENNLANGWAGGGVSFISSDEGDFRALWPPSPPFPAPPNFDWNDVLLDSAIFDFTRADLEIDLATTIRTNTANMVPDQDTDHGKGGGLYVLRFRGERRATRLSPLIITGQPVNIQIANVTSLDATNRATFAGTNRIFLDDQSSDPHVTKKDADLPAGGSFKYPQT